jgi:peptide/nickel transport system substrate-binding protein
MKKNIFVLFMLVSSLVWSKDNGSLGLTIATMQEWDTLHPISYQTAASESIMHMIQRQMVYRDITGKVLPEIAEDIPSIKNKKAKIITENGKKKIVATWKIRKEAVWSDQVPITCKDWKFSWTVGLNDKVSKTEKNIYSKIENITYVEGQPKICTVTYATDEWTFDRDLPPFLPEHVEGDIYKKWGDQKPQSYEQNSLYIKQPSTAGLYSGPYVISEIKIGSFITLKANPHFWGDRPQIQNIIIKFITDTNTLRPYLQTGQIDMVLPVGFPPDLAIAFSKELTAKQKVHFIKSSLYQGLFLNLENEILKDDRVRKALALSINKKYLTEAFFGGMLTPAETIISEADAAFIKRNSKTDIKSAQKLLDQAGWVLSADQKSRQKNGKKLIFDFKTSAGIRVLETLQTYLCSEFQKIQVECQIKNQPPRVFLGESVPHGQFELGMFGQSTYPDSSLKGLFHSEEIPSDKNSWAGGNSIRLKSKKMDQLINEYDHQTDFKKRLTLMQKIDQLIIEHNWIIPLYHRREAVVLPKNLLGFTDDFKGTTLVYPERWIY